MMHALSRSVLVYFADMPGDKRHPLTNILYFAPEMDPEIRLALCYDERVIYNEIAKENPEPYKTSDSHAVGKSSSKATCEFDRLENRGG